MDEIKYIIQKIDAMDGKLDNVVVTQAIQTEQLEEHMRRTEIAEEHIALINMELNPVKSHVERIKFLGKLILSSGGLVGLIELIKALKGL